MEGLISFETSFFNFLWDASNSIYVASQELFAFEISSKISEISYYFANNEFFFLYEIFYKTSCFFLVIELFLSNVLDAFLNNVAVYFELDEPALRRYISFMDPTLFSIYHPETIFIQKSLNNTAYLNFFSSFKLNLAVFLDKNNIIEPLNYLLQISFLIYFIIFFSMLFLSFFSKNKEEFQIDIEHSFINLSSEAEKEIFSVDDALNLLFFLLFFFGVYFGFLFLSLHSAFTELFVFFLPLLFIFYFIVLIPFNLLFDFGLFFVVYLRGSSNTSSLFFECVYDYIGVIAFFTRLLVQFVRLVLMFVVYCMMHDTVMLQNYSQKNFLIGDSFIDELSSVQPTSYSIGCFLFVVFPLRLFYWCYEVMHTFFVVTVQFSAFFTIVFWLFLLFYTFFVYEKYEHHFDNITKMHKKLIAEIKSTKK